MAASTPEPSPSIVEQVIEKVEPPVEDPSPSVVETPADTTEIQPGPIVEEETMMATEADVIEPVAVAEPPAPTPIPAPTPTPEPAIDADPQINETIDQWRLAWSSQAVTDYLNQYSKDFVPSFGLSRLEWADTRRERLQKPKFIKVGVENLRVQMQSDNLAKARFLQSYTSDTYEDRVKKVLMLQKEGYQWKIIKEYSYQ